MSDIIARRHVALSERSMAQANYELEQNGDRPQASEKAYVAVAHGLKAIAEYRGWRHNSHNLRRRIASLLAEEFANAEILTLSAVAWELRDNFFEDRMSDAEVAQRLALITGRLTILREIWEGGPNPDFVPSSGQQESIELLRNNDPAVVNDPEAELPPPLPPFNPPPRPEN